MVDCNKELVDRVGQHMTNDDFWTKFGREIEQRADAALEDNGDDSDEAREREEDNQREILIEEENIKFTD